MSPRVYILPKIRNNITQFGLDYSVVESYGTGHLKSGREAKRNVSPRHRRCPESLAERVCVFTACSVAARGVGLGSRTIESVSGSGVGEAGSATAPGVLTAVGCEVRDILPFSPYGL